MGGGITASQASESSNANLNTNSDDIREIDFSTTGGEVTPHVGGSMRINT